jgi:HPt (histidine-containing phosphotransfer) domain-containing protein
MLINYETLNYLKKSLGDESVQELIELYFTSSPEVILSLKDALEAADGDKASFWGHRLKGSSCTLGFENIRKLSEHIEILGHDGDIQSATEKYNALIPLYSALEKELQSKVDHPQLDIIN